MAADLGGEVCTRYVEDVAEGEQAETVIREMAQSGAKVIFTTSFGYMNPTLKVAAEFPKTVFMHATGYRTAKNVGTYNARYYEGRYLCGVIAGKMTKSNITGYVAAFPIPEVLQGINAFARGLRSVNPNAEVRVVWVNAWLDPVKEREAAQSLVSMGADMLTHHTDSPTVVQVAEAKGVYAFGYHSDMSKYGPKAQLTATTHHWDAFYTKAVAAVIDGKWKPTQFMGSLKDGMVRLAPFNSQVPGDVRDLVYSLQADITSGKLHPFAGPLRAQDGRVLVPDGGVMTDEELGKMDYYVEGVTSKLQ